MSLKIVRELVRVFATERTMSDLQSVPFFVGFYEIIKEDCLQHYVWLSIYAR